MSLQTEESTIKERGIPMSKGNKARELLDLALAIISFVG